MDDKRPRGVPFLLQFAESIEAQATLPFRYDKLRQLGQVLIDSTWLDAVDAPWPGVSGDGTLITRVQRETTDNR